MTESTCPYGSRDCDELEECQQCEAERWLDAVLDMRAKLNLLRDALEPLVADLEGIIGNSDGIAGWHLNGDVEPWGATDLPALIENAGQALKAVEGIAREVP